MRKSDCQSQEAADDDTKRMQSVLFHFNKVRETKVYKSLTTTNSRWLIPSGVALEVNIQSAGMPPAFLWL